MLGQGKKVLGDIDPAYDYEAGWLGNYSNNGLTRERAKQEE
jgi:hypothetical protein